MNWIKVASTDQIQDDEPLAVEAAGHKIALYRCDGEYFATDNVCTHAFALLSDGYLEDGCIECPLHQARFDVRTGEALCEPATENVKTYPVKLDGQDLLVEV